MSHKSTVSAQLVPTGAILNTEETAGRLRTMHEQLFRAYGPQHWWPAESEEEVIVGAYLTQNTAWKAVERSLQNLRAAGVLSLQGVASLSTEALQELIRPSGFVTRKSVALKAFVEFWEKQHQRSLHRMAAVPTDRLREDLLALPGVGPETADAILLYALGHTVPVADEYLRRIAERHRLLPAPVKKNRKSYEALVALMKAAFSDEKNARQQLNEFHALVVAVGKAHCGRTARCEQCPLAGDLPERRL